MARNKTETITLGEKVYQILLERILSLEYPPESVLVEKDLCAELKVSRPPVKEAILRLEEMDLVMTIPRYGTIVSHIDVNEIAHVYEVKLDLESLACSLASQRITEEEIVELEKLAKKSEERARIHATLVNEADLVESFKKLCEWDILIHSAIWKAAHNPVLEKILANLHSRCLRFCRATVPLTGWNFDHVEQFSKICSSFRKKDREGAIDYIRLHNRQYIKLIKDSTFNPMGS
jgi:DNA-binding GntR family transcriptional regulator